MNKMFSLIAMAVFVGSLGLAQEQKSEMERIIQFYTENVGKTVLEMEKPAQTKVTQGQQTYLIEYRRKIKFSPLKLTKTGITFALSSKIHSTSTKLDAAGEKTGEVSSSDRHLVFQYELAERKSTNAVLGFVRIAKDSDDESTGVAYTVAAKAKENAITFEDTMLMYADETLDGGETVFPGATASDLTLSLMDGKLKMDQAYTLFEVVPESFERILMSDPNGTPMQPVHVIAVEK